MAGIGFRLQKLLQQGSYRSVAAAYVYSALIAAGPWLLAVIGLGSISLLSSWFVEHDNVLVFRAVVIYAYAASLVLTGPLQLGTTRYIADRLFVNDVASLAPCYRYVATWVLAGAGVIAGSYLSFAQMPAASKVAGVVLFQAVSVTWVGMLFLSAAKDYMSIVRAFAFSHGLGVAAALAGAVHGNLSGMLWGYAAGQLVLVWQLTVRIGVEFPSSRAQERTVIRHWEQMPWLVVIGLFYNAGIWIDKVIYWGSRYGETLGGIFFISARYDTCMFLGYLSIVPAMSLFLIRIETGFYKQYAAYYQTVTGGGSLPAIDQRREAMIGALRLSVTRLLKLQGGITLLAVILAPTLVAWIGLHPDHIVLLRISLLAAFVQILLMILLIVLLYFDWERDVAMLSLLFFFSNAALTLVSLPLPAIWQGWGYLLACLLTLVAGLSLLEYRLRVLEFDTFTREPIRA